ncbi:MAG: FxsA family protein [Aquihabitans sp.]
MMLIVLLLIVAPIIEIYVAIQVAHVIGGWETIALMFLMGVLGAWLLKMQGLVVLARISEAVAEGRPPAKEMVDGLLILVAGALMIAPGFVGDAIGLVLLFPPTRALIRMPITSKLRAGKWSTVMGTVGSAGGGRFVGTFRATTYETTGHEAHDDGVIDVEGDRRTLDP